MKSDREIRILGYLQPRPKIAKVVLLSLLIHVGLIFVWGWTSSQSRPRIMLTDRAIVTRLVRLGKPRDKKLLPRKVKQKKRMASTAMALPTKSKLAVEKKIKKGIGGKKDDRRLMMENALERVRRMVESRTESQKYADGSPYGSDDGELTEEDKVTIGYKEVIAPSTSTVLSCRDV
jgi:hypothetical protein